MPAEMHEIVASLHVTATLYYGTAAPEFS